MIHVMIRRACAASTESFCRVRGLQRCPATAGYSTDGQTVVFFVEASTFRVALCIMRREAIRTVSSRAAMRAIDVFIPHDGASMDDRATQSRFKSIL